MTRPGAAVIASMPDLMTLRFDDGSPAAWVETTAFGASAERRHRVSRDPDFEARSPQYLGRYESPELGAAWTIEQTSEGLQTRFGEGAPMRLASAGPDLLRVRAGGGELLFERSAEGEITGFTLNTPRASGIRFLRDG